MHLERVRNASHDLTSLVREVRAIFITIDFIPCSSLILDCFVLRASACAVFFCFLSAIARELGPGSVMSPDSTGLFLKASIPFS